MSARATSFLLFVTLGVSCAEVPASTCFWDEPCSDAGFAKGGGVAAGGGAGTGGGGAVTGGGGALGGGSATGGGVAGDAGPLPFDAGTSRTPTPLAPGVPDSWDAAVAFFELHPPSPTPPAFASQTLSVFRMGPNCDDLYRGGVALPDGRILASPFCAPSFALIDPRPPNPTLTPFDPQPTLNFTTDSLGMPGHFGASVLGCDGRVYALPHRAGAFARRMTLVDDGGVPLVDPVYLLEAEGRRFSGAVVARPCSEGFSIVAAGLDGLYLLKPWEEVIEVKHLFVDAGLGLQFNGVVRIGDDLVLSAPVVTDAGVAFSIWVDTRNESWGVFPFGAVEATWGGATSRDGGALFVSPHGTLDRVLPDAGHFLEGGLTTNQRWATNLLNGWFVTSGAQLLARPELGGQPMLFGTSTLSGGLILSTTGALIDLPGPGASLVHVYRDDAGVAPGSMALAPWFNKL